MQEEPAEGEHNEQDDGDDQQHWVWLLPADGVNESCLVMQDVEGNEFDLD